MFRYSIPVKQEHTSFLWYALACIAAYLYGSLPLVYFLGRQSGANLKQSGSGNVGAANLLAVGGIKRAVIGAFFDASKGWLPILTCRRLGYPEAVASVAGVCGVAGQCWPIFLRFNGGLSFITENDNERHDSNTQGLRRFCWNARGAVSHNTDSHALFTNRRGAQSQEPSPPYPSRRR